ncbi:unnamed protein product [Peronospora belbahrii]|uniref:Uncharacterized protein n=1 Tax=Peronospora belbahrii TaxID=622444 RepID=A0AAU9KXJ6_9STRA|nr:unnamed protein product [Peronospora belbahrii]CAH0521200.1 unnamed protein product [Peronospora belbahrii]
MAASIHHLQSSSRTISSKTFSSSYQHESTSQDTSSQDTNAPHHGGTTREGRTVDSQSEKHATKMEANAMITTRNSVELMRKPHKPKRRYKKRKATCTVRKEEMEILALECTKLQQEVENLKFQTFVEKSDENHSDRKVRGRNDLLRQAVQDRHLILARAQAMFVEYAQQSRYRLYPTEMNIRLGMDRKDRRRILSALRRPKLDEARRYLMERLRGLDPIAPYFHEERYNTMEGDSCIARFDVTPFRGAKGVQQVFSALQQAIFNAEIIISESSGNITIREDDELGDDDLSHMRFLSQTPLGVQVETNLVLFSDRAHCQTKDVSLAENGHYAIIASDYVDEDIKYPYKPNERIRRDSTTATMVTSYQDYTTGNKDEGEVVVVVTRWALNIIRRPVISVSSEVWDELRNSHLQWADMMLNCVRQALCCR